ncbi:MAG: class I SAM-dependent methyltransferase [archaeon]
MSEKRWKKAQIAEKQFWNNPKEDISVHKNPNYPSYLKILENHKIETKGKTNLDIGCGAFGIVDMINGKNYAIDPLMNHFVSKFKLKSKVKRIQSKGENLPFLDNYFDIIFCINALDHTDKPHDVLDESRRCLKTGGTYFLVLNCYSFPVVFIKKLSEKIGAGDIYHPYSYNIEDVGKLLNKHGFKIIEIKKGILKKTENKHSKVKIRVSLIQKLSSVRKLRGTGYIFKRALVLPFHVLFEFLFKQYPDSIFLCKKIDSKHKKITVTLGDKNSNKSKLEFSYQNEMD